MLHCLFVLRLAFVFNGGLYYSGFGGVQGVDFLLFLVVFGMFLFLLALRRLNHADEILYHSLYIFIFSYQLRLTFTNDW